LESYRNYWEKEWSTLSIDECQSYLEYHIRAKPWFLESFQAHQARHVCDAACGFGAYSAMLSANGYQVSGFDVVETAVNLTKKLLDQNQLAYSQYIVSDICAIGYPNDCFDAVVAHAVIDHLSANTAQTALAELLRVTRPGGLVYVTFDPLEEEDLNAPHEVLDDGSLLYSSGERTGLLFRYYTSKDIKKLVGARKTIQWHCSRHGERSLLIQK